MKTKVLCQTISLVLISGIILFQQATYCCPQKVADNKAVNSSLSVRKKHRNAVVIKVPTSIGMPSRRVIQATR